MSLYHFLLVVLSLSAGSLPVEGDVDWSRSLAASAGLLLGWSLLVHVAARNLALGVQRGNWDPLAGATWLERQLSVLRWLGLGVVGWVLAGFHIATGLNDVAVIGDSMFLQSIILLIPGLVVTASSWSAEHQYGVRLGYTAAGFRNRLKNVIQSFRGGLAWLVVPVWALMAMGDGIAALPIGDRAAALAIPIAACIFVVVGLPWLLRIVFTTEVMQPEDEQWAATLLDEVGLGPLRIRRWDTGGRTFNALVAGFIPRARSLMVSDRLLDELPRPQIAMVILHEAAHLRRRHMPMRMLAAVPAWALGYAVTRFAGDAVWASVAGSVVGITLTLALLRWVAYRTEYDADLTACRMAAAMAGRVGDVPATGADASMVLATALRRVTHDSPSAQKATWLHPSVDQRVDCMRRTFQNPAASSTVAGTIANPA